MYKNKRANYIFTAAATLICIVLCIINFILMKKSTWDFYPQSFAVNLITVDYSIFIIPIIFSISLFIKNKFKYVLMAVCVIWLLFAGQVMNFAIKKEEIWEQQKPKMVGTICTDEEIKNIYNNNKNAIIFITTAKESGKVELSSFFAYWDNLSEEVRGEKSTYYYFGQINADRNYFYQTNNLMAYLDINKLPAVVVINDDGTKEVFNGLDPFIPLTEQENDISVEFIKYLAK